ncbi:hypothetical protein AB6A40_009717 [Gnathostoma spinigerum]|uniref:Large ribosomal subunit protein uL18m n=1 Tax=Gnathostoma spinigerum TaxID=75299 RepID=A0ABD6F0F9_9BILA
MQKFVQRFVNRNPRNLELLGFQPHPSGFDLEVRRNVLRSTYRINFVQSKSHLDASVEHWRNGIVLSASTREKAISSQLYSKTDTSAALNIGRVLAIRCLMSGILFATPSQSPENIDKNEHEKQFYKALVDGGLCIKELEPIAHTYAVDRNFTYDRFNIKHTREDKTDE